jgi:hypothetical protein
MVACRVGGKDGPANVKIVDNISKIIHCALNEHSFPESSFQALFNRCLGKQIIIALQQ